MRWMVDVRGIAICEGSMAAIVVSHIEVAMHLRESIRSAAVEMVDLERAGTWLQAVVSICPSGKGWA